MMLDKTYDPKEIEARRYTEWESSGAFKAHPESVKPPYCIVIPPPNVTGSLHMGHALDNTLQDVLIRWRRMKGDDVLWQPGTDHAGIATQMVVVRNLEQEGIGLAIEGAAEHNNANRKLLSRSEFLEKVWEWKAFSGGTITQQLRRLGASCDWSRERFTMDEGLSRAVLKVFVDLHRAGLIYRDNRLVNWDPKMLTAISDLEVESREVKGHLWYLRYPIDGSPGEFITVATTRPETMLGDTGIAVSPDDPKWKHLIGKHAILPLVGRRIPIVADEYSDPEKGSGAVKITPAHDFNDFEVGRRHNLEAISIFDKFARINDKAPEVYRGLDRFDARKKIVADLEALELVEKIEPHTHAVPFGDRGGVPVEPYLTEQWYADAKKLAAEPIAAARDGRVKFVPERGRDDFFRWMENIEPWCISRQLWWGHQIPAWYGPDKHVFVALSEDEARQDARKHYGHDVELIRDPDVLDTWFSSALWPFSTLGWPDETPELRKYYPTSVLVTGWDILFFWVARMMMMGQYFMKEVPFRTVYLHGLVTDEKGQKMSKSKGNVIDPLELIDKYGADALRFTMTAMAAQGGRIRLAPARVEGSRNFITKFWNATRFAQINGASLPTDFDPASVKQTVNRWMLGELGRANRTVDGAITGFRLNEAANTLYEFIWGMLCDWYVELTKPILQGEDGLAKDETRAVTAFVLREVAKLMHPVTPFITEEIWDKLGHRAEHGALIGQPWPVPTAPDEAADAEIGWLIKVISDIRSARAELNVPAAAKLKLLVVGANEATRQRIRTHQAVIERLARVEGIESDATTAPRSALQIVVGEATYALPVGEVIDLATESVRLQKEIKKLADEVAKIDAKLGNAAFISRAPEEVVEEQRERRIQAEQTRLRLSTALERLRA
jgi:valyl-tRNA synthetase